MMLGTIALGTGVILSFGLYLFLCYCLLCICRKAHYEPGIFIWLPVLQLYSLLKAGQLHGGWIFLFLVPLINLVFLVVVWSRICHRLGHSPVLALLILLPLANILFLVYLAFSESKNIIY